MSQPIFSIVLKNVLCALLRYIGSYSRFLQHDDLPNVKAALYAVAHVQHVIGAIDGTHIALVPPRRREQVFRNRKNFYSTNFQVVCLADIYITEVTAQFPASVDDAYILPTSSIPHLMAPLQRDHACLIVMYRVICVPLYSAHSTPPSRFTYSFQYPNLLWLLTPLRHPSTAEENGFNEAHGRTQRIIKRTFGVLKTRFRCLHLTGGALLYRPVKVSHIIVACCMLHNLALRHHIPLLDAEEGEAVPVADEEGVRSDEENGEDAADSRVELIQQYFH
ncbi:putative nuclease HARBI1 [Pleurodeles waltl]|uniref:putative nuclease HARBI1 n=1 Tax=Pleurodeles waltl TaxID=8319 RepID=UPI0037099CBD